ncbi:hypothetical protein D3C76_1148290 [compost metagenome]
MPHPLLFRDGDLFAAPIFQARQNDDYEAPQALFLIFLHFHVPAQPHFDSLPRKQSYALHVDPLLLLLLAHTPEWKCSIQVAQQWQMHYYDQAHLQAIYRSDLMC